MDQLRGKAAYILGSSKASESLDLQDVMDLLNDLVAEQEGEEIRDIGKCQAGPQQCRTCEFGTLLTGDEVECRSLLEAREIDELCEGHAHEQELAEHGCMTILQIEALDSKGICQCWKGSPAVCCPWCSESYEDEEESGLYFHKLSEFNALGVYRHTCGGLVRMKVWTNIMSLSESEKQEWYQRIDEMVRAGATVTVREHKSGFPAVTVECGERDRGGHRRSGKRAVSMRYGGEIGAFLCNGRVAWRIPWHTADLYMHGYYLPPDGWTVSAKVTGIEHPVFGYIVLNAVSKRRGPKGYTFCFKREGVHGHQ
jgi:hypothetical protein